jgi:hypothetical protein
MGKNILYNQPDLCVIVVSNAFRIKPNGVLKITINDDPKGVINDFKRAHSGTGIYPFD